MLLEMAGGGMPDRTVAGRREDGLTAEALLDRAARGAAVLRETGAGSVAFLDVNGPRFVTALWSAVLAGLPFCPLNYRLSREQVVDLVDGLDDAVVLVGEGYRDLLDGATSRVLGLDELEARVATAAPIEAQPVDDDATAVLLYTSGTTSAPKAVVLTHGNLTSYVLESVEFASADPDDAILVSMPPYHVAGVNGVLTNLYSGRRLVHLPNFDPAQWLETVRSQAVSHAMVVPTMMARIVEVLDGAPAEAPSLRHLAYGGARMPLPVLTKALDAFPGTGFINAYGLTETSSTIALLGPDDHRTAASSADPVVARRLGSAGLLLPGVEGQVRDDDGRVLAAGETGELWLRGRQISGSYLGRGSVLDADGWFPTRDQAWLDDDGYLFIVGRADDTIIRGGENIAPAEIEEVLVDHPAVAEVAVVGRKDDDWGERIVAVVVVRPGQAAEPEEIREFVRARLRSSRTPDDVVFLAELPYTPTGKLVRRELVAALGAG